MHPDWGQYIHAKTLCNWFTGLGYCHWPWCIMGYVQKVLCFLSAVSLYQAIQDRNISVATKWILTKSPCCDGINLCSWIQQIQGSWSRSILLHISRCQCWWTALSSVVAPAWKLGVGTKGGIKNNFGVKKNWKCMQNAKNCHYYAGIVKFGLILTYDIIFGESIGGRQMPPWHRHCQSFCVVYSSSDRFGMYRWADCNVLHEKQYDELCVPRIIITFSWYLFFRRNNYSYNKIRMYQN